MRENLKDVINFITNCIFKVIFLVFASWIFLTCEGYAAVNVDGQLDEPEWEHAQRFTEFVVTVPLTLEKPGLSTEVLLFSTPEGLAVAFICEQTKENRTRTITQRDAGSFDADSVSLMIDFDGDGQTAYEFSVSISNSYRDGIIINENEFTYIWDGMWEHMVNEEQDRWIVEILLPWSIVSMRESSGEKQRINLSFQRHLQSTDQTYAFPAVSTDRPHFVSEFAGIEVVAYSSKELEIKPYAMALRDILDDSTTGKMGLDILWKPSPKLHLLATVNPEFGYVESDDLIIDFSAYEVKRTDKRPFFTEDQIIFADNMGSDEIFYTRRVGSASDEDGEPSDIDIAMKMVGSSGRINYGFFAAQEADDAGRSYYAGRVSFPSDNFSLGALSTYTERPFLDRTALVNSLDYSFSLGSSFRFRGQLTESRIKSNTGNSNGFGVYYNFKYSIKDSWFFYLGGKYFDDTLELNDMGYASRNGFLRAHLTSTYNQTGFHEDSRAASVSWTFDTMYDRNTDGDRLPATFSFSRNEKMRSGSGLDAKISFSLEGYDDKISRNNGLVLINNRWSGSLSYNTQRQGAWSRSISLSIFQEGYEDWAAGISGSVTWYPTEKLNVNLAMDPTWSSDWLNWVSGTQIGSFSREQVSTTIGMNWFPAERHEVRLKTQWNILNAEAKQSYNIGADARLLADNAPMKDFATTSFSLQLRYHYEIAPMSDLYIVYSRGGRDNIEYPEQNTLGLLGDSTRLRDSDQIMVKLSYRFKII